MCHTGAGSSFDQSSSDEGSWNGSNEPAGCACDVSNTESSDLRQHIEENTLLGKPESRCRLPIADRSQNQETDPTEQLAADRDTFDAARVPFVVQHGPRLFFLTWESSRWTLAELEFDAPSCTFVEQRRTHYEWPREAFGVLLSRFTLIERVETSLLKRTSDDFARWLASQFQAFTHSR